MVTVDRFDYVFIRRPGKIDQFERRQIFTAKESHDVVIVAETSPDHPGLTPGQEVVTTGSLILEQLYEDREMTEGGFLVSRDGESKADRTGQPNLSIVTSPPHLAMPGAVSTCSREPAPDVRDHDAWRPAIPISREPIRLGRLDHRLSRHHFSTGSVRLPVIGKLGAFFHAR